jgi:hypothetical protein
MNRQLLERVNSRNNSDDECVVGDDDRQIFYCEMGLICCDERYAPAEKLFREDTGKKCECPSTMCTDCLKDYCIYKHRNRDIPKCPGRDTHKACGSAIDIRRLFSDSCLSCNKYVEKKDRTTR